MSQTQELSRCTHNSDGLSSIQNHSIIQTAIFYKEKIIKAINVINEISELVNLV